MAPDLNSINSNGRWNYSTPGSSGYDIPNIVLDVSSTEEPRKRIRLIWPGSFNAKAQSANYWSGTLEHPDSIYDSEVL
jgi:hypothetical protein